MRAEPQVHAFDRSMYARQQGSAELGDSEESGDTSRRFRSWIHVCCPGATPRNESLFLKIFSVILGSAGAVSVLQFWCMLCVRPVNRD